MQGLLGHSCKGEVLRLKQLGINIKILRIQSGIKQKELASKIGKTINWLCLIESGKREPSLKLLKQIADELGVTVSSLLKGC